MPEKKIFSNPAQKWLSASASLNAQFSLLRGKKKLNVVVNSFKMFEGCLYLSKISTVHHDLSIVVLANGLFLFLLLIMCLPHVDDLSTVVPVECFFYLLIMCFPHVDDTSITFRNML